MPHEISLVYAFLITVLAGVFIFLANFKEFSHIFRFIQRQVQLKLVTECHHSEYIDEECNHT